MWIQTEYVILICLIILSILVDCFRLFSFDKIKEHIIVLVIKIFLISFEVMSIKFGLNIMACISNLETKICSSSELNTLVFGIGIAFILIGLIGYIFTLITLKLKDLMNGI